MAEGLISNNGTKTEEQSLADPTGRLADRGYYPHKIPVSQIAT
jgi:hypothetical protein